MGAIFGFLIGTILAIFEVTQMLPTKFQVSWHFGSGQEAKNIYFQDSHHGGHLGFWIGTILLFLINKSPQCFLLSNKSIHPLIQEKKQKIDFRDDRHGGHLGFPIGMISAIFDLQVTQILPTKFQVNWPFGSGGEAKNRFSRWPPWLGFLIWRILAIFDLPVTLMLPTKFQVNWPRGIGGVGF